MLDQIFTKKNVEILCLLKERDLHLREIASKLNCSVGKVHSASKLFQKYNLVKKERQKNIRVYSLNRSNSLLKQIISLINLSRLLKAKYFKKLLKEGQLGIYGSFANGTDDNKSDIDLWLFTDKQLLTLHPLINGLENEFNKAVNLLILNKKKLNALKQQDYEFYIRLKLTSIQLGGDIFD